MKKPVTLAITLISALVVSVLPSLPATAAPNLTVAAYPIDRGIVTLTSTAAASPTVLQETGDVYAHHPDARNVVGSPGSWNSDQQRWHLVQTGVDTYRFLNVQSGRALQATGNKVERKLHDTSEPNPPADQYYLVTTPADWNSAQQQFRVSVEGGVVTLWGSTPAGEKQVGLGAGNYRGIGDVYWATMGVGSWTVSGYTFPAPSSTSAAAAVTIDDATVGDWTYVGPWQHPAGESWTEKNHKATESYSNTAGARATTTFYGTQFELVGDRGPNGGAFRVTVDCTTVYEGDSYASTKKYGESLSKVEGLLSGVHTVVVEVLGSHQPQSSDSYVVIDALRAANTGPSDDGTVKWHGAASGTRVTGPISLRRTACGSTDDIVQQLKNRTIDGLFLVPGHEVDAPVWGAVNSHAASDDDGPIPGPLTVGDVVRDGAAIALSGSTFMNMRVSLPDRPRTLALAVAADEVLGTEVEFTVKNPEGIILPTLLVRGNANVEGSLDRESACCGFVVPPGTTTTVIVDLRDAAGAGGTPEVVLSARSSTGAASELLVLASRVTDVAYNRYARQLNDGAQIPDFQRFAAPASAFLSGPVSLSRVLADADQPAWTGNQWTRSQDSSEAVPVTFGETAAGKPLSVDGTPVAADSISITLPAASGLNSRSSVFLRMDLGYRCRSLTASVGLDDSTPSLRSTSVQFEVFGNDQALPTFHNGLWQSGPQGDMYDAPNKYPAARHDLIEQLRDFRLAAGNAALSGESLTAYKALVNAEHTTQLSSLDDPSPKWSRYQLEDPLRLGHDANWRSGSTKYYNEAGDEGVMPMTGLFPVAVDLMTTGSRDAMRTYLTHSARTVDSIPSPLVREIEIVISGTPGAVIDLVGAGLDCVSAQPAADGTRAPDAMPTFSQIGVAPLFLPSPQNSVGERLTALEKSPMWWDMACPAGPSTAGLKYTAVRTRTTQYKAWTPGNGKLGGAYETVAASTAESTASKPACGLPADQKTENFTTYGAEHGAIPASYLYTTVTFEDAVERRLWSLNASGPAQLWDWTKTTLLEASHDTPGLVVWAMLLPFDLPVGLVLNPVTLHALPVSAQLALGAAMLSPTALEKGLVYALPAASRMGATAAREGASELLMLTTEQAAAQTAAGKSATLTIGDTRLAVPLKAGSTEADLTHLGTSTPEVATDEAVSRMAVTDDVPAFVADPIEVEVARVCKRDVEGGCSSRPATGSIEVDASLDDPDSADAGPPIDLDSAFTGGYWEKNAPANAQKADIAVFENGNWEADARVASDKTDDWWRANDPTGDGIGNVIVRVGKKHSATIAYNASSESLYAYVFMRPESALSNGIRVGTLRPSIEQLLVPGKALNPELYNVARVARGKVNETAFVAASRDPDLLGTVLTGAPEEVNPWRILVLPGAGGGGIDPRATLAYSPSATIRALARNPELAERAQVLFPNAIPGEITVRADLMALQEESNEMWIIASVYDEQTPVAERVLPTPSEVRGARVGQSNSVRTFDWWSNTFRTYEVTVPRPTAEELVWAAANPQGKLVFMKQANRWVEVVPEFRLSDARLVRSEFQVGSWQDSAATNVWLPLDGRPLRVAVNEGWIPAAIQPVG